MKTLLLSLIALAALTGCDAAETNVARESRATTGGSPVPPSRPPTNTWASVPGRIEVRRLTNDDIMVQNITYTNAVVEGRKKIEMVRFYEEYEVKVYQVPVQIIQWHNPESNVWETVEAPLIPPRLLLTYSRTNVVTR